MPAHTHPEYGASPLLLVVGAIFLVAAICVGIKVRGAARRGYGVQVYDLGADLTLPRPLHSRSYQIAFYLTMKSLPREPAPTTAAEKLTTNAATR